MSGADQGLTRGDGDVSTADLSTLMRWQNRLSLQLVWAAAAERGWKIVAFVHTHPQYGPEMSPRDLRCFERDSLPWIIIGTPTMVLRQRTYVSGTAIDR